MISRCPSCGAEVDEEAARCPSCHWDFSLRQRVPPSQSAAKDAFAKKPDAPKAAPAPKPEPPKESKTDDIPSPEPSLPASFGLKQFGKAPVPEKPKPAEAEKTEASHFAIPVLPNKKDQLAGPPATEIRRLPASRTPSPAGAPPKGAASQQKEKERLKEKQDAADRFRKKGKTQPPDKAASKPGLLSAWPFVLDHKVIAAVVVGAVIILIDAVLTHHRQAPPPAAPAATPSIFQQTQRQTIPVPVQVSVALNEPAPVPAPLPPLTPAPLPVPVPPAPEPVPTPPPAAPAPVAQNSWIFEGQAYDLITLKPIRGAQLFFTNIGGGEPTVGATDNQGRFKMYLPPTPLGGGYKLTAKHPDYLEGYIDELSPPLKEEDLEQRRVLAASAVSNQRWAGSLLAPTYRDFIMIPKIVPPDAQ